MKDYSQDPLITLDPCHWDDAINLRNAPIVGLYQPDAIASYEVLKENK
ncbi:MAG: hypothetical protein F6J86_10470 [Symploca sp. SIO1B1]|nr:hypothetical protein [Symploca sp. SIO2D2]NER94247.1 hypothetical protein [Symploca sp. SIO1B1]